VQVQQNGRWSIHARFAGHQKDGAVEEAKQLDQLPNVEAVKVIKEVYDTDQGFHNEFIIYKSAGMKSTVAQEAEKVSGGHSGPMHREETWLRHHDDEEDEGDDFDAAPARAASKRAKKGKKKKGSSLTTIVVKLLLVVLFSLGLAAMFAWLAAELFGGTKLFGVRMVGNAESNMLIGVFIFTFLTSAAAMAITVMKGESLDTSRRRGGFFSGTAKAQVAAAELALDGVRQEYRAGSRTTLDVLDAEAEVVDARIVQVSAERDRVVAAYRLLAAVGRLTARDLGLAVAYYDAERNYRAVRGKWIGTDAGTVE